MLAAVGVLVGLSAAVIVATAMHSLLFGVRALDPMTFAIAPAVLAVAALLASYVPARRAVNVSPLSTLGR